MSGTTISGLGTGLDIDGMVTAIADAEKAPKQAQIDRLTTKTETSLSAVGTLTSAVETFEASLTALESSSSSFEGLGVQSSADGVASATAGAGAVPGSYEVEVISLASSSKVASASLEGGASTTFDSGGTLTIDVGDNASYEVQVAPGASLTEIRDAINSQLSATAGISANIITDASGARLVLSSEVTGEGTDLYVKGTGDLAALNINVDEDGNHDLTQQSGTGAGSITLASNASYKIDGLELSSSTNTVTALSGLSIKLTAEGTTTLTVAPNTEGLKTSIEAFVSAYNNLITVTNALTRVTTSEDETSTDAGALVGDALVRSLLGSIRNELVQPSTGSGELSVLAQLGVTTNKDGTLSIDDAKLSSALETHYDEVQAFFVGDDGLIPRLKSVTEPYTAPGGLLAGRTESLQKTMTQLSEQQQALDRRIDSLTTSLYTKYNNMDILVAQLNASSASLLSTLEALNNSNKK
ncbi:flagellar filament capping protein FliD [Ectopseudomonas oleovorans]|uniref:Flagellar hook-associated protein 2 n=2 Tax=Ectopseudomonas oleovorans TaxID=301 RepID=A0A061CTX8_ECTOL|nr:MULTISPECIES: flagellar filament capping protein FliD [Pseudomonas]MDH1340808.1 flagellar filament capping protein FliD [Pseudomonas oleovorans]MDH1493470.1 flagellar filament capping protein FliD [Pseudomonas oleovorans]MDH1621986.1 flagellar filament capping protein FliD [Pseudomonas chengduensis]MDH1868698.1 flagellar filament capping protein FliD [Pseudomonas chengduensis]PPV40853.1 flagellar cap protein FliD [Pseudomonas oleovorans]